MAWFCSNFCRTRRQSDTEHSEAIEEERGKDIVESDYDNFYEVWRRFDPKGTGYIHLDQLSDFLDSLDSPLQYPKPNKFYSICLDINIYRGDMLRQSNVLDSLVKFHRMAIMFYRTVDELPDIQIKQYKGIWYMSSTLWRQHEHYCARVIQRAWRRYCARRRSCG